MSKWNKFSANCQMNMIKKEYLLQKDTLVTSKIPANASLCQIHRLCEYDTCLQKVEFTDTEVTVTLILNMLTHKCTPPNKAVLAHFCENQWDFVICQNDNLMKIPIEYSHNNKFYTTTFVLPKNGHDTVRVKMDYNKYNSQGSANYLVFDWIQKQIFFECNYLMTDTNLPNYITHLDPKTSSIKDIIFDNIKKQKMWFSNSEIAWHSDDSKIYNIVTMVVWMKDGKLQRNKISDNQISVNDVKETDILEIDI